MRSPLPHQWDGFRLAPEIARRRADVTQTFIYGVPANLLTAMRYPCHDEDEIRAALAMLRSKHVSA